MSIPSPSVNLWYSPGACSFAPHVILLECSLQFELTLCQIGNFSREFYNLNQKGRVPVLAVGDEIITEMPAILTAIALQANSQQLLGSTNIDRCRIYEWMNYLSGTLHTQGYGALWRPGRFVDDPSVHPKLEAKALGTIQDCYSLIEGKLNASRTQYAIGSYFTVVDPFLLVFYQWGKRIGLDMTSHYPGFTRWAKTILERDSVIQARTIHVDI